ncbi:MAG: 5-formyltetrahydrofolate cyclo-ligase [Lactobacillaceae bacterium]|jgi:5-formyltetrahydrofolate cyclo-ligase|nr:5-formyltetrahydrofolate cyclo-ligase [Lactobacillaceae bacterium]
MKKKLIRENFKQNLRALNVLEHSVLMQKMVREVTALPVWQQAKVIGLSMAQPDELPTQLLIQTALLQDKRVGLPRVAANRQMDFIEIDTTTEYVQHRFGMLEPLGTKIIAPAEFDLMVVPGLGFATDGQRLGFGGGYYDRYLPQTATMKIGVTIKTNFVASGTWLIEPTDIAMDTVIVLD